MTYFFNFANSSNICEQSAISFLTFILNLLLLNSVYTFFFIISISQTNFLSLDFFYHIHTLLLIIWGGHTCTDDDKWHVIGLLTLDSILTLMCRCINNNSTIICCRTIINLTNFWFLCVYYINSPHMRHYYLVLYLPLRND